VLAENSGLAVQDYVQRGRPLERESADGLKAHFIARFRRWALNPRGRLEIAAVDDVLAEYDIRGVEWPAKEVRPEMEAIRRAARVIIEGMDAEEEQARDAVLWDRYKAAQKNRQ
jgi:hypothetical protein